MLSIKGHTVLFTMSALFAAAPQLELQSWLVLAWLALHSHSDPEMGKCVFLE